MLRSLVLKEQEVLCDKTQKEPRGHVAGSHEGGFWAGAVPSGDWVGVRGPGVQRWARVGRWEFVPELAYAGNAQRPS